MEDFYEEFDDVKLTRDQIKLIEPLIQKEINRLEKDAREVHNNFGSYASESYYKEISQLKDILRNF